MIKNKAVAQKALAYVTLNMINNDFSLDTPEDLSSLDFMTDMYSEMEQTARENAEAEKENMDDPEYGLVASKPIYTNGKWIKQVFGRA